MLNEFTFAARVASVSYAFRSVVLSFSLADDLDGDVKFSPRFYLLHVQSGATHAELIRFSRAWVVPFGVFLFVAKPSTSRFHAFFIVASSPQIAMLRMLLNRLRVEETLEKPSLSTYFWRMNVLR